MRSTKPTGNIANSLVTFSLLAFLFFLLLSCGKSKHVTDFTGIPADSIIPHNQMVKMLADIHVLEAAIQVMNKKETSEQELAAYYFTKLFSKYHMTEKRFHENLGRWQEEPDKFCKLYEEVINELDKRLTIQKHWKEKKK